MANPPTNPFFGKSLAESVADLGEGLRLAKGLGFEFQEAFAKYKTSHPKATVDEFIRTEEGAEAYGYLQKVDTVLEANRDASLAFAKSALAPVSKAGGSAQAQMDALAEAHRKAHGGTREQAFAKVIADPRHRGLADQVRADEWARRRA